MFVGGSTRLRRALADTAVLWSACSCKWMRRTLSGPWLGPESHDFPIWVLCVRNRICAHAHRRQITLHLFPHSHERVLTPNRIYRVEQRKVDRGVDLGKKQVSISIATPSLEIGYHMIFSPSWLTFAKMYARFLGLETSSENCISIGPVDICCTHLLRPKIS